MIWTFKETVTKLTLEPGGDWVSLLPFTLYWVPDPPYTLGLNLFEIMYIRLPPFLPNLKAELLAEFGDQKFLSFL